MYSFTGMNFSFQELGFQGGSSVLGDFRCGVFLFIVILVIHVYINIEIGENRC